MKKEKEIKIILKNIYNLLDWKQKRNFIFIIFIMIISAFLSQITPKAIGWITVHVAEKRCTIYHSFLMNHL